VPDRRGIHHHAATEILSMTLPARIAGFDEMLSPFEGPLPGRGIRRARPELQPANFIRIQRKWDRKVG
jgi:hypothetical protein